jgi:hypothetical protein
MDLEILEALALSDDRSAALAQLLPGSEDHDYYRALHAQHRGALDEAEAVIAAWPDRHGPTPSYDRLRLRQLLLRVTAAPQLAPRQACDQLRDWFGVSHWHEAEVEASDPSRPSRLPPGAFDPEVLLRQAVERDANLSQVCDEGLAELVEWPLEASRRRAVLSRLMHTPQPEVVALVADELGQRGSGGFGSLLVHRELTLDQLRALAELRPELRGHAGWVAAMVTRMRPPLAVDLELDLEARGRTLDELWRFVAELPASANSLKAHILWHLLDTARRRGGAFDHGLFRAYLALPRAASYLARGVDRTRPDEVAKLGADFATVTGLAPAGSDEQLIRDVIQDRPEAAWDRPESYAEWLDRAWLEVEFATAGLLSGKYKPEPLTVVLGPARAAALRERVELTWCAHNPTRFAADEPVALEVDVKNVPELVVKVFRIDPLAYYQHHRREVDSALDLDGLAASREDVHRFSEPPIQRVRRRLELTACARPGTYVIDLIGNGMSSRAVVHKGRLRHAMRVGAAGHVIAIFDETGRPRPDARAWIGDREYAPDERGAIVVPFSTSPGRTAMLLTAGDIASVAHIELVGEAVQLELVLALDRQSLTAGRMARAIARLALTIGGAPASLALLKQPTLDLVLTDRHGVATTRSQPLPVTDDDAAVLEWPLGDDTAGVALAVRGRVHVRSEQREREVSASRSFHVATMHGGPSTEALYLAQTAAGWVVSALGKTGEPRAHRPVTIGLVHRWAATQLKVELSTDARGRVELGPLPGARRITATLGGLTQSWDIDDPLPGAVPLHIAAGRDAIVRIPPSRSADELVRRASLVELRGNVPARHVAAALDPLAGAIAIRGLAPGDYQLRVHGIPPTPIVVTAATAELAGAAIAPSEVVQLSRFAPAIAALDVGDRLTVALRGAGPRTRVHLIATRFAPAAIGAIADPSPPVPRRRADRAIGARYVSGRELGDEYRYVLERRSAQRFPGLLLDKPSLLLNPWSRRTTSTDIAVASAGAPFAAPPAPSMMRGFGGRTEDAPVIGNDDAFVGYDFLAAPPVVLANLVPDGDGKVSVALAELGAATSVTAIVDDPAGFAIRRAALAEPADAPRDLRLALALDPERHATQRKAIAPLTAGDRLVIEDVATAKLHLIDSVERAHAYLLALRDDPTLREFAFVTRWHALPDAERRELYSKYACHELHLFLYFKDRAFFDAVIKPYLAHKRTRTFIDDWLLGGELDERSESGGRGPAGSAGGEGGRPLSIDVYLEPARLARLNAVERALLGWRISAGAATARLLGDEVALQPPDPGRDARLIDALLGASTLDGDDRVGAAQTAAIAGAMANGDGLAAMELEERPVEATRSRGGPGRAMATGAAKPKLAKSAPHKNREYDSDHDDLSVDLARRDQAAPMFRPADKTQEWAENNWWHLTPAQSGAALIAPSRLWRDLAHHTGGRFLSPWLGLATGSFAEAMCALAVSDLPFAPDAHAMTADGPRLTVVAGGSALAGSSQLVDGPLVTGGAPIVVGMSYVRADDRHDWSTGEQVDKYVDGPLATGVVYTCLVVLANPTSSRQRVSALVQIPRGSLPVAGARATHTVDVALAPYGTHGHEVSFYFPAPGRWSHFPVHVSRAGQIVAAAPPHTLEVHPGGGAADPRSWPHLSQRASLDDVVAYLATANLAAIDLPRAAWRMRDRAAYAAILGALDRRRAFDPVLWGYAFLHGDAPRIRAWLRAHADRVLAAGPALDMLGLDAEDTGAYEHLELAPLINARAHRLGSRLRILNDGLAAQYTRFLELVAHRAAPTARDLLAAAHYLLAQDRIAPALAALARAGATAARMQHDYLAGYAACLTGELGRAREVATRWRDHPVDRWRHRFGALAAMLDEIDGAAPAIVDVRSREQQQGEHAARQPAFELAADRDGVVVRSQHVAALELRFFEMDVELLFSRQPFVQSDVSRFSFIEPGHREQLAQPGAEHRVAWPAHLRAKNVVVEAVGAGMRKACVHYAHDLATNLSHQYGQIRVQRASDRRALSATYVKVYARKRGGAVAFYKDGYTDLRGWFDYASLSTTELDTVERFAILVCSDREGAAILEAGPPAR